MNKNANNNCFLGEILINGELIRSDVYLENGCSEAAIAARGGIKIYDTKAVQDSINKISSFLNDVKTLDTEPDSEMVTQFENLLNTVNGISQSINNCTRKHNHCDNEVDC